MPRRFLSRRSAGGSSFRRSGAMRVWTSSTFNTSTANNTQVNTVVADAASFGTTPGNTKWIGTLLRIRGFLSVTPGTPGGSFNLGLHLSDVGESVQDVSTAAFGQDEEVLYWRISSTQTAVVTFPFEIDVKAKRRFDVEAQLMLSYRFLGMAANSVLIGNLRCLFLVP